MDGVCLVFGLWFAIIVVLVVSIGCCRCVMGFGLLFVCGRIVSLTCLIGVAVVVCCGFDGFASLVL